MRRSQSRRCGCSQSPNHPFQAAHAHISSTDPVTQYSNSCLTDSTNSFANSSIWTQLATKRGTARCPAATQQLPSLYLRSRITETRFRFRRNRLRNDSEPVRRACENASGRNDTCRDPRDARPRAPKGEVGGAFKMRRRSHGTERSWVGRSRSL